MELGVQIYAALIVRRPLTPPPRALSSNPGEREPDREGDALIPFTFLLFFYMLNC
jgi:hypothetical protein